MEEGERSQSLERLLKDPELDLGRRLFPRGLQALVPDARTRFLGVCALVGAGAALAALAFRTALQWTAILFFGPEKDLIAAALAHPAWERFLLPASGAVLAAALARVIVARGGGGVAGIMEAVSIQKGFISLKTALAKSLCSFFSIASGGSVGREGPIVQLAAAVGSAIGRRLGFPDERLRVLVACGAAAGFAAAYNTPMAATLFVVEVVAGTTSAELLGPVAVAAVISTAVTHITVGDGPLYEIPAFALVSVWEFIPYTLLAVAGAVLSTVFLGSLDAADWVFARLLRSRIVRGVVGGLLVGAIGVFLPHVYGNGFEATLAILNGRYGAALVATLLVLKLLATASTVGSGGAGGVFTPTLMLGACLGALVGAAAHAIAPGHTAPAGAYALVGMAALLAATTHAPLTATIFVYEVTRDYAIVLPLLLTGYVATAFSKALRPHSIYEEEAHRRGVDLDRNLEQRALRALLAEALIRPATTVLPGAPLARILEVFETSDVRTIHVADVGGAFVGVIDLHTARERLVAGDEAHLETAARLAETVRALPPEANGSAVADALYRSGREEVPIVAAGGRLLGVVSKVELDAAVDREVIRRGLRLHESRPGG